MRRSASVPEGRPERGGMTPAEYERETALPCIHLLVMHADPDDPDATLQTRIMRFRDLLPNLRINGKMLELPAKMPDGLASDLRGLTDRWVRTEYDAICAKLTAAAREGDVYDERCGHDAAMTLGRMIPVSIWNRYGDLAVLGDDGLPIYNVLYTTGGQESYDKYRAAGRLHETVRFSYGSNTMPAHDYLRPCGLASCTRHGAGVLG